MGDKEKKSIVPDFMKKAISGSVKSVLSTEESIRSILSDLFPKEITNYFKEILLSAKNEGIKMLGEQVKNFLDGLDVDELLKTLIENYSVNIKISVSFDKKVLTEKDGITKQKRRKKEKKNN